jgi:hypothetical protein
MATSNLPTNFTHGETLLIAKGGKTLKAPSPWQPVLSRGRWLSDEFGAGWLQVEEIKIELLEHLATTGNSEKLDERNR